MIKYGKKFRKIQLLEWKGKYFDYKKFKQFIKKNNPDNLFPIQENEKESDVLNSLDKKIQKKRFRQRNKKSIYIFYSKRKKER